MTLFPVITRELRAQARQRFTFRLRELGVMGLLVWGFIFSTEHAMPQNVLGPALFRYMHLTLFLAIWILVPLSASDCLSRERREGTLGLLFLTPLRPIAIIMAKSVAHGLRAATLIVAVLPVLTIPILMGGVSWQQATTAALINFSALCWALAASVVASAGSRSGMRAMVFAIILSLCGILGLMVTLGMFAMRGFVPTPGNILSHGDYMLVVGGALVGFARRFTTSMAGGAWAGSVLPVYINAAIFSLVVLMVAALLAAWRIKRTWREEPAPQWVQDTQKAICTPVVGKAFFRRWMRWLIERNPIGWLEQRSWTGRIVTWSWFAIIISIYSAVLSNNSFFRQSTIPQTMAWLLMGSIGASVAGSFRRERESGVLELLLVTPMSTKQIIGGRLRGLWFQFLPAVVVLLFIWGYFAKIFQDWGEFEKIFFFTGTFVTLPIIGLYFSVRSRSFISAFLATLFFGLLAPRILERFVMFLASLLPFFRRHLTEFEVELGCRGGAVIFQLLFAAWFGTLLYQRLKRRNFPVERAVT